MPNDRLLVAKLDVSSLKSIQDLQSLPSKVDVLVQNAGMIAPSFEETPEGLESTIATHVVSSRSGKALHTDSNACKGRTIRASANNPPCKVHLGDQRRGVLAEFKR